MHKALVQSLVPARKKEKKKKRRVHKMVMENELSYMKFYSMYNYWETNPRHFLDFDITEEY
jgi:hypothetical protein